MPRSLVSLALLLLPPTAAAAPPSMQGEEFHFTTSDGITVHGDLQGEVPWVSSIIAPTR